MIGNVLTKLSLEDWYYKIEGEFGNVEYNDFDFSHLCNSKENIKLPIYSWYNLKEAFSFELPQFTIKYLKEKFNFYPKNALDPFMGGGTTLLSLSQEGIACDGIEYNPFIFWTSEVKLNWKEINLNEIKKSIEIIDYIVPKSLNLKIPELSTFKNKKYFNKKDIKQLLYVLKQIEELNINNHSKNFLKIGIANIIEDISNLRKDGRALRYIEGKRKNFQEAITNKWNNMIKELEFTQVNWNKLYKFKLFKGSSINMTNILYKNGRLVDHKIENLTYDLIVYSPPYLNNFDYSEIYKLELWLMGFINSNDEWKNLRLGTIKSHHSLKFQVDNHLKADPKTKEISDFLDEIINISFLNNDIKNYMINVIKGYFDDMYLSLKEQYRVLSKGGFLVFNVANSKHKNLPIATDLILGKIAKCLGFKPLKIISIHKRNGRTQSNNFLRESIVIMKKE